MADIFALDLKAKYIVNLSERIVTEIQISANNIGIEIPNPRENRHPKSL